MLSGVNLKYLLPHLMCLLAAFLWRLLRHSLSTLMLLCPSFIYLGQQFWGCFRGIIFKACLALSAPSLKAMLESLPLALWVALTSCIPCLHAHMFGHHFENTASFCSSRWADFKLLPSKHLFPCFICPRPHLKGCFWGIMFSTPLMILRPYSWRPWVLASSIYGCRLRMLSGHYIHSISFLASFI